MFETGDIIKINGNPLLANFKSGKKYHVLSSKTMYWFAPASNANKPYHKRFGFPKSVIHDWIDNKSINNIEKIN